MRDNNQLLTIIAGTYSHVVESSPIEDIFNFNGLYS